MNYQMLIEIKKFPYETRGYILPLLLWGNTKIIGAESRFFVPDPDVTRVLSYNWLGP